MIALIEHTVDQFQDEAPETHSEEIVQCQLLGPLQEEKSVSSLAWQSQLEIEAECWKQQMKKSKEMRKLRVWMTLQSFVHRDPFASLSCRSSQAILHGDEQLHS